MVKNTKTENEKIASILCYFLVGIIWYFVDENLKKNSNVKFHSKQALNLIVISIVLNIGFTILYNILFFMRFAVSSIESIVGLAILILWIIGLINAINSKKSEIPIVGQFANKYLSY